MKRALLVLSALAAFSSLGSAAPLCTNQTMDFYVTTFVDVNSACQVGDKLFYAFTYVGTSSNAVAPTALQVNVAPDGSNLNEPGLIFSSGLWSVSGTAGVDGLSIDSAIGFRVATVSGLPLINGASLDFTGHSNITGGGQAFIGETVILGGGPASVSLEVDTSAGPFLSSANFAGVSGVKVTKNLQVRIVRGQTGTATITQFREGFIENAPEPVSTVLFGSGLAGLMLFRRRRAN